MFEKLADRKSSIVQTPKIGGIGPIDLSKLDDIDEADDVDEETARASGRDAPQTTKN